jgi:tetratricopeptide (TPR) repeat protein
VYTTNRGRFYALHPLIAEFARGHFSSENQLTEDIAHSEAARYYHHLCLSQARAEPRNSEEAKIWIEAIWHYYQARQWQAAYDALQQSNLFACLQRWGEYAALLEIYTLFLNSNTWQPELATTARMNNELGEIYSKLGVKDKAQHHFKQALQYSRTAKAQIIEVKALNNLGSIYRAYGQIEQALVCYQDAMHLCDGMQEYGEQGVTFNNLGRALQDLGQTEPALKISKKRYRDAIIYYKQALKMYNSEKNALEVARTLNNLGEVHGKIGRSKETLAYFRQALDCFRSIGEKRGEGIVCNNLGTFYRKAEQYVDALEYYARALRIFRAIGTQGDEAIVLRNLGHVYIFAQRNDVALACFLLARDIYEEMHQPERGTIARGLQALLAEGQSFEQAVTAIGSSASVKLEKALERGLY